MKLCNDTVTVYNAKLDRELDATVYAPTVIHGVSWYGSEKSSVDKSGLNAACQYTIRIPANADCGGKGYTDAENYKSAADVSGMFTLNEGDFVVKGQYDTVLYGAPDGGVTILAVTDNRRAPKAPHWKVVCA